ncbi:uncharacterized protein LTR77_009783 [Saxophila tyrrhenica]|uniref:Uncharacterized protein n=1 Tax=Saxophila tyrrhenica TaxID=1690608 RepID=A0AAV9NXB3_9PEZI|nr:hypothetical protein LTR77_009783 [Saxophila tyrrhenica]
MSSSDAWRDGFQLSSLIAVSETDILRTADNDPSMQSDSTVLLFLQDGMKWLEETAATFRASSQPGAANNFLPSQYINRPSAIQRQRQEREARDAEGFPDLNQMPHGLGSFEWLDSVHDPPLAQVLGLETPVDILVARQFGALDGMGDLDRPRTVFYPDERYFEPSQVPDVPGRWEFMTTHGDSNARVLAQINFNNDPRIDNVAPTAQDIWNLRQRFQGEWQRGERDDDPTEGIELVWIPNDFAGAMEAAARHGIAGSSHEQ